MTLVEVGAPTTADPLEQIPVSPAIPNQPEVLRILKEAREKLARPYGWIRGSFRSGRRLNTDYFGYCTLGALGNAEGKLFGGQPITPEGKEAASIIADMAGVKHLDYIPGWNDNLPRGGKRIVLETFDRAIAYVEEH